MPRVTAKVVVAVLLLVLLGTSLALAADGGPGTNETNSGQSDELTASPLPKGAEELPAERTATSRTFELPDRTRETRLYQAPVNYRDEDGKWQPIEEGLRGSDGSALRNGANSFDLTLPARLGAAPVRFSKDDAWVASRLLGAPSAPVDLEDGKATYQLANPETSVELSTLANGVKENIEIASPSAPSTFHYELTASAGVTPSVAKDGAIEFRDQDDDLVAQLPAPFMFDSSGTPDGFSNAVEYELKPNDSGAWLLTVAASKEWLDDPGRKWPVTIDPSIFGPHPPFFDCSVYSAPPIETLNSCGQKGAPLLGTEVYERASTPDEYSRTLAFFRLIGTSIPTTADVIGSEMHFYSPEAAQHTNGVELTRLTAAWSSYVSWKYSGYPNCFTCAPWATPGGTGSEWGGQLTTADRGGSAAGWWDIPLQEKMVQDWVTGGEPVNFGVAVKQLGEQKFGSCTPTCLYRKLNFHSSAASNSSLRPYLSITYIPAAPATSKVISPTDGTRTAKRLKLQATWTSGVTGVTWQYRELNAVPFQTIPPELVRDGENQAISKWPVEAKTAPSKVLYLDASQLSPTLRKEGGPVQIRAVFEGGAPGYSAPVEAKLDPALGGPKDATAEVGPGTVDLLTGNFTVSKTDVSIPTFNSSLDFSRTFSSRDAAKPGNTGVLGQGWKPGVPVEENGAGQWRSVKLVNESEVIEGESYSFTYALATGIEGSEIPFEKEESGAYKTPDELTGWSLTAPTSSQFVLRTPDGTKTTFDNTGSGSEYLPIEVSQPGASTNSTRMTYAVVGGNRRLTQIVAPSASGANCVSNPQATPGCRVLTFNYATPGSWGGSVVFGDRLTSITYHASGLGGPWTVAEYKYDTATGRLKEAWDPRISPALKETYTYEFTGQIKTITPPGLKPWTMEYGTLNEEGVSGRLMAVKRDSLVESTPVAQTTIAYGVPLSGSGLPSMTGADVAKWGQSDLPVDATAIFPPDEVPSTPPSSYTRATLYYLDADGYAVNTATPAGAGTAEASISTSETDKYGNVVRELTPQNRVRALAAGTESVARSQQLETSRVYEDEGTEMVEERGPLHDVRLEETGAVVQARAYKYLEYDQGYTPGSEPAPHQPTTEKTAALVEGALKDLRTNKTEYNWTLRKPIKTIIDAGEGGLNISSVTVYDKTTGLPLQYRQPSDTGGGGAGTTRIIYWNHSVPGEPDDIQCKQGPPQRTYTGLPCKILPAAQPGGGLPKLVIKHFLAYNALGQPTEVTERPGGEGSTRKTINTFDAAGRLLTTKAEGGGTPVPKTQLEYAPLIGAPTAQRFVCEPACGDDEAVTTGYDALGRVTKYQDADGNTAETTYDLLGRPLTTNDGKGTQTRTYDAASGLLTELEDSAAGTFTASYDADGNVVEEGLPNGLVTEQSYDEAGQLTDLVYDKAGSAWLDFEAERSINGQILWQKSLTSRQQYSYDKAGRLVKTNDWDAAVGGNCTTREYVFGDPAGSEAEKLAGKNSNRTKLFTRTPGVGGACTTSGGSEQKFEYDSADRLKGEGIAYDDYGRITSLPAVFAGGNTLATSYFSTDMVASQTQNGVTNTFQLDSALRQRQRTQGGGLEGVEVFHYAGPSDTPAWTQLGAKWSRNISGIGGSLAAIQDSSSETLLQLTNLHGDVVATATLSTSATEPVSTFEYDEFGVPKQGGTPQFGWLGGEGRRTEFASGVIQMGARSYVPSLGRFISVDPILGGSASAYDYANADPVNGLDLTGLWAFKKAWWNMNAEERTAVRKIRVAKTELRRSIKRLRGLVKEAKSNRRQNLISMPDLPVVSDIEDFFTGTRKILKDMNDATECTGLGGFGASAGILLHESSGLFGVGTKMAGAAKGVGRGVGLLGASLGAAGGLGIC